jgi:adenine deaminase
MESPLIYNAKIVDIFNRQIYNARVIIENGRIADIFPSDEEYDTYILPGFIDSHIHIESSMLTPQHFARVAVTYGTVGVVADPHEIANVLGRKGVEYFIENADKADLRFFFGAPSCVPATIFETAGASINPSDIDYLFSNYDLKFLSEVMNYPGVVNGQKDIIEKIAIAKKYNKRIDGHAPGLTGESLDKYLKAGISTDHECYSLEEALEKIGKGMHIQIREGSAAKNFNSLFPLIDLYPGNVSLCSDDLHPDDLLKGHINLLVIKAVEQGLNIFNVLRAACINPVVYYKLDIGLLRIGDKADFIRVQNLKEFKVIETVISGKKIFELNRGYGKAENAVTINNFNAREITSDKLIVKPLGKKIKVISVENGELITHSFAASLEGDFDLNSDLVNDVLKLVVLNRYSDSDPAISFVHNFGLKKGAIASSVAHDSHNIISTGVSNKDICSCINWIIQNKGGIAVNTGSNIYGLPLPVAGIISDKPAEEVAKIYKKINDFAADLGCTLESPFMTLSFLALLVIPEIKLSDKGLFNVNKFDFTDIFIE